MRPIIKYCLSNVIAACERYKVDFPDLLLEISQENTPQKGFMLKFAIWIYKKSKGEKI